PVIAIFSKKSENESFRPDHGTINSADSWPAKNRIFTAEFQKIEMQIVIAGMFLALRKIQLASLESALGFWIFQTFFRFRASDAGKLFQKLSTPLRNQPG